MSLRQRLTLDFVNDGRDFHEVGPCAGDDGDVVHPWDVMIQGRPAQWFCG